MSKVSIRKFSRRDGEAERKFLLLFPEKETGFERPGKGLDLETQEGFAALINERIDQENGIGLKEGYVPHSTFWILLDGQLAGIGNVRHHLNDSLRRRGGHIGMAIAPGLRGKNVGTEGLRLLVEYARLTGLGKILVTNNEDNWASRRISEKNGGTLEKVENGTSFYWI